MQQSVAIRSQNIPEEERAFIDGILSGRGVTAVAEEIGWPINKTRALLQSSRFSAAVASQAMQLTQTRFAPAALNVIVNAMHGVVRYREKDGNVTESKVSPAIAVDAAKTILKLAGWDKVAEINAARSGETQDLAEMSTEQLRNALSAVEAQLAGRAAPVDAPNAPLNAVTDDEKDNIPNVLE